MQVAEQRPIVEVIPPPDTIRVRLAELAHEAALLRSLLRVSERRERQREYRRQMEGSSGAA